VLRHDRGVDAAARSGLIIDGAQGASVVGIDRDATCLSTALGFRVWNRVQSDCGDFHPAPLLIGDLLAVGTAVSLGVPALPGRYAQKGASAIPTLAGCQYGSPSREAVE